jgi:signal transduction histidine kinase
VTQTVSQLQDDLSARAEHLRQLMLAVRAPAVESPDNDALTAALIAYASQLDPEGAAPAIRVAIDPALHLDWATMTVVYRIAQEAVANALRHGGDARIAVSVALRAGAVALDVHDDGEGFDPRTVRRGSGLTTMELFAELGGGRLRVLSAPGRGTSVHAELRGWPCPPELPPRRRHLRAVPGT